MRRLQIAPMMGYTDTHFRYLMRLLGGDAFLLFSEMITVNALLYGESDKYLAKTAREGDVVLQIGGSDPKTAKQVMGLINPYDYVGCNLNVGCPSDRVQNAKIGACLMAEGQLVGEMLKAMQSYTDKPVSIKCRLGIDGVDSYDFFKNFVDEVLEISHCHTWIVHARDAWLQGLSPRQNRMVPPLRYEYVYRLKQEMPYLNVTINGGFTTKEQVDQALLHVDGVMLGRAAYQNPRLIHELGNSQHDYQTALKHYSYYLSTHASDANLRRIIQPLVLALNGYHGAKRDRASLAACRGVAEMMRALEKIEYLKSFQY